MSKKLIFAAFAFVVALAAQASTMYWMVEEASGMPEFSYAKLVATGDSGTTWTALAATTKEAATDGIPLQTELGTYGTASYSFAVELCNENGEWVGQSNSMTYDQLVSAGAISGSIGTPLALGSSSIGGGDGNWNNIPEPTSGMLLLVGLAALSLRRRRRV